MNGEPVHDCGCYQDADRNGALDESELLKKARERNTKSTLTASIDGQLFLSCPVDHLGTLAMLAGSNGLEILNNVLTSHHIVVKVVYK